jgi:hypothetical protein
MQQVKVKRTVAEFYKNNHAAVITKASNIINICSKKSGLTLSLKESVKFSIQNAQ